MSEQPIVEIEGTVIDVPPTRWEKAVGWVKGGGFGRNLQTLRQKLFSQPLTTRQQQQAYIVWLILLLTLFAFEAFNFDTTRYALNDILGNISFLGVRWATILAIAFCGIDFAGLIRILTPTSARDTHLEIWYLMIAWLIGATMNALMTWYAISLLLLEHTTGNEIFTREQLIQIAPILIALLVWITRILFIGALSVAGARALQSESPIDVSGAPSAPQLSPDPSAINPPINAATPPTAPAVTVKKTTSTSRKKASAPRKKRATKTGVKKVEGTTDNV